MFIVCDIPMHEKIYFEKYRGNSTEKRPCPLCHLHKMVEEDEKEIAELKGYILELEKERKEKEI